MKQTLDKLLNFVIGVVFCAIGLLIIAALFGSCTPKIIVPNPRPWEEEEIKQPAPDTLLRFYRPISGGWVEIPIDSLPVGKFVVDTLYLVGEDVYIKDSFPCPPALTDTTWFTATKTVTLPARMIPIEVKPDTIIVNKLRTQKQLSDMSWPERLTWMSALIAFLIALWRSWKKEDSKVASR